MIIVSRQLKHPPYKHFRAYQTLADISDDELSKALGKNKRTINDKIKGYYDFTPAEGSTISTLFGQPQELIFLT